MSRTPNKYDQAKTLNKGASSYVDNASGGPDASCGEAPRTGLNRKSSKGYNVNRTGGGYQGRNVSESQDDMPANKDPRD